MKVITYYESLKYLLDCEKACEELENAYMDRNPGADRIEAHLECCNHNEFIWKSNVIDIISELFEVDADKIINDSVELKFAVDTISEVCRKLDEANAAFENLTRDWM